VSDQPKVVVGTYHNHFLAANSDLCSQLGSIGPEIGVNPRLPDVIRGGPNVGFIENIHDPSSLFKSV
jgi:hypothetical protein